MIKLLSRKPTALRLVNPSAAKIKIFTASEIGRAVQQECRDRSPAFPYTTLFRSNVDDVALGVCKTGAEEAGVTEVRTSLSEKKFELWREIKVRNMIKLLSRKPTALRLVNPSAAKIKIFTASALTSHSIFYHEVMIESRVVGRLR